MNFARFNKPIPILCIAGSIALVGYFSWRWFAAHRSESTDAPSVKEAAGPTDKIIVGDQAQKNLGLMAKPLRAEAFWKTINVPGTVRDRPGMSEREITAPAIGIVGEIRHAVGDTVRPGELLFTIKLSSDSVHESQAELFKTTQDIKLAQAHLKRLADAGDGIPQSRVIETENEIKRLEAIAKASRDHLLHRGLSPSDIEKVAEGQLISEIPVVVPMQLTNQPTTTNTNDTSPMFEFQELKVEAGQQVQAGQTLCVLSNQQSLWVEGRAFRDEIPLLEHNIKRQLPVTIDFQEAGTQDWPALEKPFLIRQLANTIDPASRTFAFLIPLENQLKTIDLPTGLQRLWRFRPGQKVWLHVPTEELANVFVVPADAVVREGPDAFVFTQNVNTFERKGVHLLFQDREQAVIANDGSLPTYQKQNATWTIAAIVQNAAAQLNRMTKAGSSSVPKGYHIHADGSLHKNEDEGK